MSQVEAEDLFATLGDDALIGVLARVPFRDPTSLIPCGFYWNPEAHVAVRVTCKRFQKMVDSDGYREQFLSAKLGRVSLGEANNHVQTSVHLGAQFTVRAFVTFMRTVRDIFDDDRWCHLAFCQDATAGRHLVIFSHEAALQLRSHCSSSLLAASATPNSTYDDYPHDEYEPRLSAHLFDDQGVFAVDRHMLLVMRCCYMPYTSNLLEYRHNSNQCPFDLRCFKLELVQDQPRDWRHEGRALLQDIRSMQAGAHVGSEDGVRPLHLPGWSALKRPEDEGQESEQDFARRIFFDYGGGGDEDDEEWTQSYWTGGSYVYRSRDENGNWRYWIEWGSDSD